MLHPPFHLLVVVGDDLTRVRFEWGCFLDGLACSLFDPLIHALNVPHVSRGLYVQGGLKPVVAGAALCNLLGFAPGLS